MSLYSREICEADLGYPCYVARGRWDYGAFLSIGLSGWFDGFAPGRFVVIAASRDKDSEEFQSMLKKTKAAGAPVYVKKSLACMGCMH